MTDFNKLFDCEGIQANLNEIENNSKKDGDYPEVPVGRYEVKIEKIELGETKNPNEILKEKLPVAKVQFRIVEGEYKKSCLFYNQVLLGVDKTKGTLSAFGIKIFDEFLETLDSGLEIKFKDFSQYKDLLLDVAEAVATLTYDIEYSKKNDYPTYKVKNIYED